MNTKEHMMKTCMVHDVEVKVGDTVAFVNDTEQWAKIVDIIKSERGDALVLENVHGFSGQYIDGKTITTRLASECWAD